MSGLVSFPGDVIIGDQLSDSFVVYSTSIYNAPVTFNSTVSFAAGTVVSGVTFSGITFNLATNTLTGTSAQFNTANSDDDFVFAAANKASSADVITGTDNTKYTTSAAIRGGLLVSGAAIATTSGTSHNFTSIPSWAKKITLMLSGVSTNGTSPVIVQIGTGGSPTTTGYSGSAGGALNGSPPAIGNLTSGVSVQGDGGAGYVRHGIIHIMNLTGNTWIFSGTGGQSDTTRVWWAGGTLSLAGALDMVRLTTVNGTDTFDAGSVNIIYE